MYRHRPPRSKAGLRSNGDWLLFDFISSFLSFTIFVFYCFSKNKEMYSCHYRDKRRTKVFAMSEYWQC
jgi:hypothetical protein